MSFVGSSSLSLSVIVTIGAGYAGIIEVNSEFKVGVPTGSTTSGSKFKSVCEDFTPFAPFVLR